MDTWAMDMQDGWVGHNNEGKAYGRWVEDNEEVTLIVDRDNGTLQYIIQGEEFPIAYESPLFK